MIVTMTARDSALHYEEALSKGTAIWREFIGDVGAELPWDANIRIELGADRIEEATGGLVDEVPFGDVTLSVKLTPERK